MEAKRERRRRKRRKEGEKERVVVGFERKPIEEKGINKIVVGGISSL